MMKAAGLLFSFFILGDPTLAVAQDSLWDTPSVWNSEQQGKRESPPPIDKNLPPEKANLEKIKRKCEEQFHKSEIKEVARGGGTVSRYREMSGYEKVANECKGQVGEGFCRTERAAETLEACVKAEQAKEQEAAKAARDEKK